MSYDFAPYPEEPPYFSEINATALFEFIDHAIERRRIRIGRCASMMMEALKLLAEKYTEDYDDIVNGLLNDAMSEYERNIPTDPRTYRERVYDGT